MRRLHALGLVILVVASSALSASSLAWADEPATYAPDESEVVAPLPSPERPSCPAAPEPAVEGADPAVVEQRLARIEADAVCAATVDRLGEISDRLWWVVSEELRGHAQGVASLERAAEAVTTLGEIDHALSVQGPLPEAVRGEVVSDLQSIERALGSEGVLVERLTGGGSEGVTEATEGLQASVDAGAESTRSALWYLIGVAAGGFVGYLFYRQVMPRA